ncbi:TnsD family transposase [Pseudoalteromonas elyakovii]|nr:TnsD family transposase [Pseudoalteromonas elyakovii]
METSNLSYFPAPVDGETVYSWLTRYHIWSGHNSFRKHSLALFGVNTGQAAAEFPSFLPQLSSQTGVDIDWIIEHMVDVSFYKPFLTNEQYSSFINSLRYGKATALQSQLGMVANRITPGKELYFCPKCVEADKAKMGFPFWHVEHQIVGLISCPAHHIQLVPLKKVRSLAALPPVSHCRDADNDQDGLSILIQEEFGSGFILEQSKLTQTYIARLNEFGLVTSCGHLRLNLMKEMMSKALDSFSDFGPYKQLQDSVNKQYPECLFYNSAAKHHPIKHLFFIYVLFGSWQKFVGFYRTAKLLDLPAESKSVKPNITLSEQDKTLLESGASLRSVSASTGISVSTLKILAQQQSIEVDTRPQKIFKFVERDIWRKLFVGCTCTDIAQEFEVSVGAVEQILRKHQYLKPLRKKIWFYKDQCEHRARLNSYFKDNPEHTRKQFRAANSAAYMWLYRHDKEWLEANLPEQLKRIYWPRKALK